MEPIPVDLACDAQGTAAVIARSSEHESCSSRCDYSNDEGEQQRQQEEAPAPAVGTAARFGLMSPFRTMRHRLFTEETLPVQNTTTRSNTTSRIPLVANRTRSLSQSQQTLTIGMSRTPSVETDISFTVPVDLEATPHTMTDKNPFLSQEDDGDEEQDHGEQQQREDEEMMSDHSTVSSISKDSARRINHNAIDDPAAIARAPPAEIFVRSRSNESSGISSNNNNSVPRISLVLPITPPRTPNQNVIPLWQQNWVQGEIMAAHQTSATANAAATAIMGGRLSPPRPPHIVTSAPSPMLPRPVAPKHEAEAALAAGAAPSHWQTVQPQPQEQTSLSPPLRRQNKRCVVSVTSPHKEGQLEKQTVVSPNLARVNTDTSRTATTMATSPTTTTPTCEPPNNHHHHHSQARPILLQRPVIVTRAATTPCVTSKFIPVTPVTDQMSSEHLGTPRPRHTHSQSVGSVGDRDRDHNHLEQQQLWGDRPRRKDVRGSATVFSFGSIVGQSSILTPTSNTTPTGTSSHQSPARQFGQMVKANRKLAREAARTSKDDGSFMSSTRRKSAVQQDIEFLWTRVVVKPVRRWTGTEERIDLQRSSTGCLT